jgi:hypothetical protein
MLDIIGLIVGAFNGTEFIQNPWNTTFSPWTELFARYIGNGNIFYMFPLIILTVGIYFKTENAPMTSVFMIGSGALLSFGSLSAGLGQEIAILFGLFAAMGLIPLFTFIFFGGD